ncbi:uncharacterized protein LOC106403942 [Brassica napus]|uniref:uncharacterized protein LOC106403942 n=1 Tax=Brassica napus TaxID=3708 RepID=UPI00207A2D1D|nr:uncharacterized protein LOC106403942 [Brassica napus]
MSKIANLDFSALKSNGDNYLEWALDAKIMLRSKDLGDTITKDNNSSDKDKYIAIYMIHHHLQENLKTQYMTMENPYDLWIALQRRYDHQKTVLLPKAQYDWKHIRFLDYKSVDEYNSVLFRIVSLLSEMRPPGTAPLPDISKLAIEPKKESNLVQHNDHPGPNHGRSQGRGRGSFKAHGRGRGRGTTPGFSRGRGRGRSVSFKPQIKADRCHRCGMGNHWAKNCRTPKHLCELYMESLKRNPEANMVRDPGYDGDDDDDLEDVQDHQHESDKVDHMEFETSDILK